jgi:radical SAM protein with 4Fe4S-binding SPASM domain
MERLVLLADGDVIPCHAMAPGYSSEEHYHSFGNVRGGDLREIWESDDCRSFRRRVLAGDFPPECQGCDCSAYLVP